MTDTNTNLNWDEKYSDDEEIKNESVNIKQDKSTGKANKLKDLFSDNKTNTKKVKTDKDKEKKHEKYEKKDEKDKNSKKDDLNKPNFTGKMTANQAENQNPKVNQPKTQPQVLQKQQQPTEIEKTAPVKEDVKKPQFVSQGEGKLVSLEMKNDLFYKNNAQHSLEEVKYTEKKEKDDFQPKPKEEKKEYTKRNYNNNDDPCIIIKQKKKKDDGVVRDEEGYEVDEDGFHDANAKKEVQKAEFYVYQNKKNYDKSNYRKNYNNNTNYTSKRANEVGIKGEIKGESTENDQQKEKEEVKKVKEEVKKVKEVKEEVKQVIETEKPKKLKDLFG